jgi:hypothetical protein
MDDRDRRRMKTPPRGVREQTAGEEIWDEDVTPLPIGTHEALAKVDRRVKKSGTDTADRVERVRAELRGDVRDVDRKVDELMASILRISEHSAEMAGQMKILVSDREADRQERAVIRTETVRNELEIKRTAELAGVEVGRSRELADIEEAKRRAEHRRKLVMEVLAGVGVVWAAVSTLLMSRGC